jgi:hypothetical protein
MMLISKWQFYIINQKGVTEMRVLALGGAGEYGKDACRILALSGIVSEIVIAGRSLQAAQKTAKDIGGKARAVSLDASDQGRLAALAQDYDIVMNTTGPEYETVLEVLKAAITAGTNYCDIGADGPTTEAALELDSMARSEGIVALLGIGACPGVISLMMLHATRQLDTVEEVSSCGFFPAAALGITEDLIRSYRETGRLSAGMQMLMKWVTPPFPGYRGGMSVAVKDQPDEVKATMPGKGKIPAVLVGSPEAVTVPRAVPEVHNVSTLLSWFPFQLNGMYLELGRQVARGKLNWSQAALHFLELVVAEQNREPLDSTGLPKDGWRWVEAIGIKEGKRTRYNCWPTSNWYGWNNNPTSTALALAALKILGGEIGTYGILTPESCLDPLTFFKEAARQMTSKNEPGKLVEEVWQTL